MNRETVSFFIAGSSIDEICGIFGRVRNESARFITKVITAQSIVTGGFVELIYSLLLEQHRVQLCYKHDQSGWLLALIESPPEELAAERERLRYAYEEPCGSEWVFIDKTGKDLFKHKGDTIVPGAGVRWKHLHRSPQTEEEKARAVAKAKKAQAKAKAKEAKAAAKAAAKALRKAAARAEREEAREIAREERREARREAIREVPWYP